MYLNKINMVLDIYVAIKKNNYKLKFKCKPWITRLGEEEKGRRVVTTHFLLSKVSG